MAKEKKSFVDFKKVKEQVSIEQILEYYGIRDTLSGNGRQIQGACPIHGGGESSTSFSVNLDKNCWNCFGECDSGGNILDLVAALEDCSIRDAALKISKLFKLSDEKPRRGNTSRRAKARKPAPKETKTANEDVHNEDSEVCVPEEEIERPNENTPLSFSVLKNLSFDGDALIERQVLSETTEHFGVGFCSRGLLSGRIAIPIHNPKGELLAYVGTAKPGEDEQYFYPPKFVRGIEVYNVHRAVLSKRALDVGYIIATDYFDVLKLFETGRDNVLAIVDDEVSPAQLDVLSGLPEKTRRFLVLGRGDDDRAEMLAGRLANVGTVRIVRSKSL